MAKERDQVPANLKWRVEDIFASQAEWDALYDKVSGELDFSEYQGKLDNAKTLLDCMTRSCWI